MVPTFSDWQISPTFPVFFVVFQYFKVLFYLKYGTIFHYFLQFSSITFSDFSSILGKIPWLENALQFFQVFQSEWEPCNYSLYLAIDTFHNPSVQWLTDNSLLRVSILHAAYFRLGDLLKTCRLVVYSLQLKTSTTIRPRTTHYKRLIFPPWFLTGFRYFLLENWLLSPRLEPSFNPQLADNKLSNYS